MRLLSKGDGLDWTLAWALALAGALVLGGATMAGRALGPAGAGAVRAAGETGPGEPMVPAGASGTQRLARQHAAGALRAPVPLCPPGAAASGAPSAPAQDDQLFWAWDFQLRRYYQLRATNVYRSAAAWIYVESTLEVPRERSDALGRLFDDSIYPTLRAVYGRDPHPGIDDKVAITLLLLDVRDPLFHGVAPHTYFTGYFDPTNELRQVDLARTDPSARSNEREMIYLDAAPTEPGGRLNLQDAAHEFAHLIQWGYDTDEAAWLNEGLADLAVTLCGLGAPEEHVRAFLDAPELPISHWQGEPADYGRAYTFLLYLYEQTEGHDSGWLRRLVRNPDNGLRSISTTLAEDRTLPEMVRDYGLALHLDRTAGDGRHGFRALTFDDGGGAGAFPFPAARPQALARLPESGAVEPWSVAAFRLDEAGATAELAVEGSGGVCVGIGWRGAAAAAPDTACAGRDQPALVAAQRVGPEGPPLILVVSNGSDAAAAYRVSVAPGLSARSAAASLSLPFGLRD